MIQIMRYGTYFCIAGKILGTW